MGFPGVRILADGQADGHLLRSGYALALCAPRSHNRSVEYVVQCIFLGQTIVSEH